MNQQSWQWLIEEAQTQAARTGQRRYIVGQRLHYQGWSGWVYNVVSPEEYVRHLAEQPARRRRS